MGMKKVIFKVVRYNQHKVFDIFYFVLDQLILVLSYSTSTKCGEHFGYTVLTKVYTTQKNSSLCNIIPGKMTVNKPFYKMVLQSLRTTYYGDVKG